MRNGRIFGGVKTSWQRGTGAGETGVYVEKHLSNKFAALSLAVTDATISGDAALAPTAVAALITAANNPPASIGEMAAIVGLTHSATVRLIDRLEADGLLHRRRRVGREVLVEITPAGRRRAEGLQDHRLAESNGFLACLSIEERVLLDRLVDRMLRAHAARGHDRRRLCRMCSRSSCTCCFDENLDETKEASPDGTATCEDA
nr:MarR family transcriptional regulator [Pleomorphomonas sp. NRK KF1]